jgi:CelD/BcsL family acetyltransferase involved in cellulose biosynthesis
LAASELLTYQHTTTNKYGASNPQALDCRPHEVLMHGAVQTAVEHGCRRFDFGICHKSNDGLRRYKTHWGAAESEVFQETLLGSIPRQLEDSLAMRLTSAVIRRSPTFVCRAMGEMLYRYSF